MELLERYLQETGKHLSAPKRADILAELRSGLLDTLEGRYGTNPSDAQLAQVLQEMGAPRQVASSFQQDADHLIGPTLFPTFKLVLGIVISAVFGAQLLAICLQIFMAGEVTPVGEIAGGLMMSIPNAFGMVVLVFAILQYFGVRPTSEPASFDPFKLPALHNQSQVKRGEVLFSLIFGVLFLALFVQLMQAHTLPPLLDNPVLRRYFYWIALSFLLDIGLNSWLLWRGQKSPAFRLVRLGVNIFQLVILFLLVQGHTAWLAEKGVRGLLDSIALLEQNSASAIQIISMASFRLSFAIAMIVTLVETLTDSYKLARKRFA